MLSAMAFNAASGLRGSDLLLVAVAAKRLLHLAVRRWVAVTVLEYMGALPDLNHHADRLVYAVALYKAGKAPPVVLGLAQLAAPENLLATEPKYFLYCSSQPRGLLWVLPKNT